MSPIAVERFRSYDPVSRTYMAATASVTVSAVM